MQRRAATGEALSLMIDEPFRLHFEPAMEPAEGEIERDDEDCDTLFYADGMIDLG